MGDKRRRKGESALILALSTGQTVREAAKTAGIAESTAYRRLRDEEVRQEISAVRTQMLSEAIGRLSAAASSAVGTLETLLESSVESVRLGAARAILDRVIVVRESLEFAERLERIEQVLGEQIGASIR
jgi:hypothetical protein